jgi:hypothetical protein
MSAAGFMTPEILEGGREKDNEKGLVTASFCGSGSLTKPPRPAKHHMRQLLTDMWPAQPFCF